MGQSIFQPILSESNTGSAKHIQSGVVDKSSAMAIEAFGGMAVDAWKGHELATYEKNIEKEIEQYRAPEMLEEAKASEAALNLSIEKMDWASLDPVNDPKTTALEQQLASTKERINKYKSMVEQGAISPDEFTTRVTNVTRQAVNRMPGLYQEIIGHGKKVLGLSGIEEIIALDKKTQQKLMETRMEEGKFWRGKAVELGVDPNDPMVKQKVLGHNSKMTFFNEVLKGTDVKGKMILNDPQMMNQLWDGAQTSLTVLGNQYMKDTGVPAQQRLEELSVRYNQAKRQILNSFGNAAGDPLVKDNIKFLDDQYQMYVDVITGKLPKEIAENTNAFHSAREQARLGIPEASVLLPFWNALGEVGKTAEIRNQFFKFGLDVLGGNSAKGLDYSKPQSREAILKFTGEALRQSGEGNPVALGKTLESFHETMVDPSIDNKQRRASTSAFLESLAKPGANKQLEIVPAPVRSQLLEDTKVYVQQFAQHIASTEKYPDNTDVVKPRDLVLGVMGNTLVFSSLTDSKAAMKLNQYYGKELNNAISTMANLNGHGDVRQMIQTKESGILNAILTLSGGSGQAASGLVAPKVGADGTTKNWWEE